MSLSVQRKHKWGDNVPLPIQMRTVATMQGLIGVTMLMVKLPTTAMIKWMHLRTMLGTMAEMILKTKKNTMTFLRAEAQHALQLEAQRRFRRDSCITPNDVVAWTPYIARWACVIWFSFAIHSIRLLRAQSSAAQWGDHLDPKIDLETGRLHAFSHAVISIIGFP